MKDGVSFLEENKSFIKGIETRDRPIFGGNGDYGGVNKSSDNRSSDKEEDAGKKCPGCGVAIKSNWTLCMQCKKKEYRELFENKVKPLFNELDFVYKKDIKNALNKPDAYLLGFFKEILDTKLLYVHKKGRLNVYHLKPDLPASPGQDDVESKHECEFCGGPVKYNHIVCSKCRPAWLEERFKKIKPLFDDGELHHAPDITKYAQNFIKPSTVYSILYDFTSKGWLEEVKIGRFKYYKLPENTMENDNAESLEKGIKEESREEPCHIDGLGISMEEGIIEASRVVDENPTPQVLPSQKISQKITSEGQTEHISYPQESQVEKPPKDNKEVMQEEVIEVPIQSLSILITQDHQSNKTIIEIRTGGAG